MAWDVRLTSPLTTADVSYRLAGAVTMPVSEPVDGASVRLRSLDTGWAEEVFLDANGAFHRTLDLTPDADQDYELSACDGKGRVVCCSAIRIRHRSGVVTECEVASAPLDPPGNLEYAPGIEPPWPVCAQRIRHCLHLAATVAQTTGRKREELLQYVHAQERYAEQAHGARNQALYRECLDNLDKYAAYLEEMRQAAEPRPLQGPPSVVDEIDARQVIEQVRTDLAAVWKEVRARRRGDLEPKLKQVAAQAQGIRQRFKLDPDMALQEAQRLRAEIESVKQQVGTPEPPTPNDSLPSSRGVQGDQRQVEQ